MNAAGINGPCNVNERFMFEKWSGKSSILRRKVGADTYRTVIKRRATDCDRWKTRRLWTCCLHIAHTIAAIRTIHIYGWSWRVGRRKACSCVCCMRRCRGTVTLCCRSLIIIHNCKRKRREKFSVFIQKMRDSKKE